MTRKAVRPVIVVQSHYNGEETIIEAFSKVYVLILNEKKMVKPLARTFDTGKQNQ